MTILSPDQLRVLQEAGGALVLLTDPQTNESYVLLKAETYQRLSSVFDADDLTDEEKLALLAESGKRAGWDRPEMDDYDDYDAHRP